MNSIFPTFTLDRTVLAWDDYLTVLTPVELKTEDNTSMWFKRGDTFAPLGYGGINGDKLRVAIWLLKEHIASGGSPDIIHGTVVGSPQSPMATAVSRHFGGKTVTVLGATKPATAIKHDMVAMSAWFGSSFSYVGSGYNATIQPHCKRLVKDSSKAFYLEYGITTDHSIETNDAARIRAFHEVGAPQVQNIPKTVSKLLIPAGSCNSCMSILLGLALYPQPQIKEVHLVGIGPNRIKWINKRLEMIKSTDPELFKDLLNFESMFHDNPEFMKPAGTKKLWGSVEATTSTPKFKLHHYDLHTTNWVRYNDLMPNDFGDISLHPRYEGKVLEYLNQKLPHLINEESLFWIIGSKPSVSVMKPHCPELGEVPIEILNRTV